MAHNLSPEDLARKRVRDRKSQNAMRERTKFCILDLQQQVANLQNALANQTAAFQVRDQSSLEQIKRLEAANQRLKQKLEESRYVGSELCLENFMFPVSDSVLSGMPMPRPVPDGNGGELMMQSDLVVGSSPQSGYRAFELVPLNCASTCLSDRILQNYIETRRGGSDDTMSEQPAYLPDINALLTPHATGPSQDNRSISTVVSDILLSYHEIDTLPRKVAALYVMYKLLNWLIYRTQSIYEQIPGWLRPHGLQLQIQHPAWIDRIPWPNARIYLISHPEITFDHFAMVYSSSFDVSWPYNPSHILLSSSNADGGGIHLNPVYEQHVRQLGNWTIGEKFRKKFPELSSIIDQDSLADFES